MEKKQGYRIKVKESDPQSLEVLREALLFVANNVLADGELQKKRCEELEKDKNNPLAIGVSFILEAMEMRLKMHRVEKALLGE